MKKILFVEPVGGASGDMLLAAFVDLGWDPGGLREELEALGFRVRLGVRRALHSGVSAARLELSVQPERVGSSWREMADLLERGEAVPPHRRRAVEVLRRLAEAEAAVHGIPLERVHFHELGNTDTLVDVLGVCRAVADLQVARVVVAPPPLGRGSVESDHGRIPLPAPATLELLKGREVFWIPAEGETVTPTGAALLVTLADAWGHPPPLVLEAIGWGAGARPTGAGARPNVVRLTLGRVPLAADHASWEEISVLTCQVDDMTPEEIASLGRLCLERGAKDFYVGQGVMKKGRPGWRLEVLVEPAREGELVDLLLHQSTTLGLRVRREGRWVLPRAFEDVETPFGTVRVKWARRGAVWTAEPEFGSLEAAARRSGVPLPAVRRTVHDALRDRAAPPSDDRQEG
jgi:hypothetical protein